MSNWIPAIEKESCNGTSLVPLQTHLFTRRKLFLTNEIDNELANTFAQELIYLSEEAEPVDIYINSPGGSVNAGLLIYDVIQACSKKIDINLYCIGMAASMAAVILAGGQKGRRFILPHSQVMIHEPLIAGGLGGSASSIKKTADSILETKKVTNGLLAKHTLKSEDEIDAATAFDNFMNAEQAIEFGICDSIKDIV